MDLIPMAELRKLTLKALLGSLAFAAVAGVVAVLVANDIVFRVMGTGFLTAGAGTGWRRRTCRPRTGSGA